MFHGCDCLFEITKKNKKNPGREIPSTFWVASLLEISIDAYYVRVIRFLASGKGSL